MLPHNWRDGVRRIPLHLATWGTVGVFASIWFGWLPTAFVLGAAIRGEYQDVVEAKTDTSAKAVIDFISQVSPSLTFAILKTIYKF